MSTRFSPGQVIDLHAVASESKPTCLLESDSFKLMRLVLPAGKLIPEHKAPQCVAGKVEFTTMGAPRTMVGGCLLQLEAAQPHSLLAIEDSIMLITMAK
jgi:quercetin dioxygenase-like cupin family protein